MESFLDKVIFIKQCLSKDTPPDKGFNLILFRNRCLFYNPTIRRTAIEKIGQSLMPGGYLAIGSGENLDETDQQVLLTQASKTEKIYKKKQ